MVVLRDQDRRRVAGDLVEHLLRRLDPRLPVAVAPAVAAQPAPRRDLGLAHAGERLLDRRAAVQLHLALRERPGREVDVRVREGGEDAAAAEVDDVRAGERGLVDADAARDVRAGDRERPSGRQRRIERADDPVLQNHGAEPSPYRTLPLSFHPLNDDGECSPDPQESRDRRCPLGLGAGLGRRRRSCDRSRADSDHRPGQRGRPDLGDGERHRQPRRAGDDLVRRVRDEHELRLAVGERERRVRLGERRRLPRALRARLRDDLPLPRRRHERRRHQPRRGRDLRHAPPRRRPSPAARRT